MKTSRQLDAEISEHQARAKLLARLRKLVAKWQRILGVKIGEVHVRKMKTYWASINERDKRVWFSLELAGQSPKFVEYVVAHELVHMLTDGHDERFYALMDRYLPGWRQQHAMNAGPMTQHS